MEIVGRKLHPDTPIPVVALLLLFDGIGMGATSQYLVLGVQNVVGVADVGAASGGVTFFRSLDDRVGWLMSYATSVGLIACLWFAIGLALTLRPYERGVPWRSAFLAAAGVIGVVSGQIASWDAAVFRSGSLTPQVASYAYDLGNISFANSWVATGAVGICAGLVMLRGPGLPRWAAWWGLIAGVGEVLARAWFRHGFAYAPFALYWAWVLDISALLLAGRLTSRLDEPARTEGEMS